MKKPLVSVTWLDAHGSATTELEEHELPSEPAVYTTHGLLVKECAAGIVIASDETPQHTYRGWTFIPAGMVQSIKYLDKQQRKRRKAAADVSEGASIGERVMSKVPE